MACISMYCVLISIECIGMYWMYWYVLHVFVCVLVCIDVYVHVFVCINRIGVYCLVWYVLKCIVWIGTDCMFRRVCSEFT